MASVNSPASATSALVRKALARLDLYAALTGIIFCGVAAAATAYAGARATTEIALSALAGSVLYLVLRSRGAPRVPHQMGVETAARLRLVLNVVFVLALAASLLLSHGCWHRPQVYFVLMSVAAAAAAGEMFCSRGRLSLSLVLVKALLIAVTLRAGLAYEFPGFYGTDTWSHAVVIESWAGSAHMTRFTPIGETSYYAYPVFHLFAVSARILSALPARDAMFLSATLYQVFSILSVFVVVRRLASERAGLLAALLASFATFLVTWGAFMIPNALGTALFAVILMLVLRHGGDYRTRVLLLLMCGVLIATHTISSFATAVSLAGMLGGTLLWRAAARERFREPACRTAFVALFWVAMLSHWMYAWFYYQSPFFRNVFGWFQHALRTDVALVGVPYAASDAPLNRMFFLLLIAFAVVGALGWLSQRERNSMRIAVLGGAAAIGVTIVVFPILNIGNLLTGRWLAFAFLLAVGPMACG
ncbi:MAG: glycosyltransferase family 39 protein, partial [Chloroflexi bacterium]|nr:glycosyltransferase family 39 protein [Chloroflexota bacterium]